METPRSKSHPNLHRGVRVVGKIRPFLDSVAIRAPTGDSSSCSTNCSQISLSRIDGEHASIAFGDQANGRKDSYKLDWCYGQDEAVNEVFSKEKNSYKLDWCYGQDEAVNEVFSKEVKPLIHGVLKGCNGCVIAYGAQGSGKTQLIKGSEKNPGFALMAISEILPAVEELGGLVNISCYEVREDRVYDLLETKEQEVLVMEDASRRIQLKGLSQSTVKSIADFKKSYFHGCNGRKTSQKVTNDVAIRSHKGLIIYVSYVDKESNNAHVAKMNFVDLAGYEDTKRKTFAKPTLAEIAKVNKSLYALLNVVRALNSCETYIPYRESKLTHLLQNFLCRTSAAVVFTCLNQTPCQDTVHAVSLASRSCQVVSKHQHDSAKNNKSGPRFLPSCSPTNGRIRALNASVEKLEISQSGSVETNGYGTSSARKKRPQPLCNVQKKLETSLHGTTEKKANKLPSASKGRMRFNLKSPTINSKEVISVSGNPKDAQQRMPKVKVDVADENKPLKVNDTGSPIPKEDVSAASDDNDLAASEDNDLIASDNNDLKEETDLKIYNDTQDEVDNNQKETPTADVGGNSPTITDKLREISNSLRLASSKPISVSTPLAHSCKRQVPMDSVEPKTPGAPAYLRLDSRLEEMGTPQDILKARSTGLKKSLVQECLTFLNSANKDELKELKGIGDKRASYIIELREKTREPFKNIEDLKDLGLSTKQIRGMVSQLLGDF